MSLRLTGAAYTYGRGRGYEVRALEGVSLSLDAGELVLVAGSTGSGKSTLLRLAAGLLEPERGEGEIDGRALTSESARGRVGLMFQDPESQLFADTVRQDVAFGPRNMGSDEARAIAAAETAMTRVGLPVESFGDRSPFSLSGGEARRAAIAGVLAMQPDYLLADEPTAGLDAQGRATVRDLLLAERERSGVLVVSHRVDEFLAFADRLIVLAEGRVEWSGSASEAIAEPELIAGGSLRLPDVLEVQRLVRARGLNLREPSLDPVVAADRLAAVRGGA